MRTLLSCCLVALAAFGLLESCEAPSNNGPISSQIIGGPEGETSLRVPDLDAHPDLDPLKISVASVGLASFMGEDTVTQVMEDLYSYFHLSNIGEWDGMFEHFPSHRTADTAMLQVQKDMMEKWFHKGLRNRAGGVHIRYVSPWMEEADQRVSLLGMDLLYYLDFFENFEGNPEGMRLTLQDQYGKDAVVFQEFDQVEEGDTTHVRQFEINAQTSMYVLSSLDSLHSMFLPPQISKSPQLAAEMMDNATMLELMRHKREHFDTK